MLFLFLPDLLLLVDTGLIEVDYLLEFLFILHLHFVIVFLAEFFIVLVFFGSLDHLDDLGLGLSGLDFLKKKAIL